jgi:hypothetical protein
VAVVVPRLVLGLVPGVAEAAGVGSAHAAGVGMPGTTPGPAVGDAHALAGAWTDTTVRLPPGTWTDLVTGAVVAGGDVPVADLLGRFPVALLECPPG